VNRGLSPLSARGVRGVDEHGHYGGYSNNNDDDFFEYSDEAIAYLNEQSGYTGGGYDTPFEYDGEPIPYELETAVESDDVESTEEIQPLQHRPTILRTTRKPKKMPSGYYLLVGLLTSGLLLSLMMTFLLNLTEIELVGESKYTYDEIVAASGFKVGDNLVRLDTEEAEMRIKNTLPYIEVAEIRRSFPDSVVIEVAAGKASANIEYGNGYLLTNVTGKILGISEEPEYGLPIVKGLLPIDFTPGSMLATQDTQKCRIYLALCDELSKQGITKITEIDITDKYNITLNYENRITIELGNWSDIPYKLRYSTKTITQNLDISDDTRYGYLIIRGTNGVAFVSKKDMEEYKRGIEDRKEIATEETVPSGTGTETGTNTGTISTSVNTNT
jgi:cell division protein FtsQ